MSNLYLNLEDDVSTIVGKLKKINSSSLVLVCPKRCFLFKDQINLHLLKKQADLAGKEISILTMDEKGRGYARRAGFKLKSLLLEKGRRSFSDISPGKRLEPANEPKVQSTKKVSGLAKLLAFGSKPEQFSKEKPGSLNENSVSPKILVADSVFPSEIKQAHELKQHKHKNQRRVAALAAASLLIILLVFFVVLPKATVIVYPKTEPVTRDMEISLGANVQAADVSKLILPAKKISESLQSKNTFQSQGKKEVGNKASGTVKIYNFTKLPINLKSSTTILTVGSKTYRLAQDINSLKPVTYKNPKTKEINPNSLGASFAVIAQDGGESFNLPAGTRMEISNQVFGSNPQFLYAKIDTAITGGTSRFISVVTDQDIKDGQTFLTNQLIQSLKDKLAKDNLTVAEKSYNIEIKSFITDKAVNSESPSFEAVLNANITGLGFDQGQLQKLVMDRISQTMSQDKTLELNEHGQIDYKIKSMDLQNEIAILLVHFEGKAVRKMDLNDLAQGLVGKSKSEVNEILKSRPEIEKIDIILAPAWQQNFPWFRQKISVIRGGL